MTNIIITNYNNEAFIVGCLASAVNQKCNEEIHVCLIDDNSTDGSITKLEEVVGQKLKKDEWNEFGKVSIFPRSTNAGPSVGRNMGIEHVPNADYVAILDGDDEYMPDKVSIFTDIFKQYPNVGCVYSDYIIHNIALDLYTYEYKRSFSHEKLMRECIVHSAAFIRKSVLEEVKDEFGYFDHRMKGPEDYDLWIRISEKHPIYHVPKFTSLVRFTGNNISNTKAEENQRNYDQAFALIRSKLEKRNAGVSVTR